jgi:hypothetical protein
MARPRQAPKTKVGLAEFANEELEVLVTVLTDRAKRQVARPRILGALVLAARQLPPEVVEALLPEYDKRARAALTQELGREGEG